MHKHQTLKTSKSSSWINTHGTRPARSAATLLTLLLLGQSALLQGQGFGYLDLEALPPGYEITPMGDSRVVVTWIDAVNFGRSVLIDEYRNGFQPDSQAREIYSSSFKLTAVKHEINGDEHHFLSVTKQNSSFWSQLLHYDPEYRELAQDNIPALSSYAPPGRMLGPDDRLFVSSSNTSCSGRFVEGSTLSSGFPIIFQKPTTISSDPGNTKADSRTIYATGLDTAIESDGSVTALYVYNWLRLKRYRADKRLEESLLLDRPPFTYFTRTGMTSVAVNENRTTLMAWEWHEHTLINDDLIRFPSIPAFRAIRPDGTMTATVNLVPASPSSDHHDRPAAAIRPDGTGAVAWTVRSSDTSEVWLQRLDAEQEAYEPARLVDARPDFHTDKPLIKSDKEGNLFLAWRCKAVEADEAQIGILELSQIDAPPSPPRISCVEGKVRIDWENRPATRNSLWYSCDLSPDHAVQIHQDEAMPGPCHHEQPMDSTSGFYWLRSE